MKDHMLFLWRLAPLVATMLILGCEPPKPVSHTLAQSADSRFSVTLAGEFYDNIAYGSKRGIYVLRDSETGRDYVGISGVGIAEISSHSESNGKTSSQKRDER
jgi:hypothetical protein